MDDIRLIVINQPSDVLQVAEKGNQATSSLLDTWGVYDSLAVSSVTTFCKDLQVEFPDFAEQVRFQGFFERSPIQQACQ